VSAGEIARLYIKDAEGGILFGLILGCFICKLLYSINLCQPERIITVTGDGG
jgi:high-affinity Fe2+/Pb2+ permease